MSENRIQGPRRWLALQAAGPSRKKRTEKWSVVLWDEHSCESFRVHGERRGGVPPPCGGWAFHVRVFQDVSGRCPLTGYVNDAFHMLRAVVESEK